jgi:chromosome segregation ATPase
MKKIESSLRETNDLQFSSEAEVTRINGIGLSLVVAENLNAHEDILLLSIDQVTTRIQELADQIKFLAAKEHEQDLGVILKCKLLEENMVALEEEIEGKRIAMQNLHSESMDAATKRFRSVSRALSSINVSIATFYERLVDNGECYLSYASDSLSLFAEGVQMIARSENRPWTDINKLSGGQQAACGVSVSKKEALYHWLFAACLFHLGIILVVILHSSKIVHFII